MKFATLVSYDNLIVLTYIRSTLKFPNGENAVFEEQIVAKFREMTPLEKKSIFTRSHKPVALYDGKPIHENDTRSIEAPHCFNDAIINYNNNKVKKTCTPEFINQRSTPITLHRIHD